MKQKLKEQKVKKQIWKMKRPINLEVRQEKTLTDQGQNFVCKLIEQFEKAKSF